MAARRASEKGRAQVEQKAKTALRDRGTHISIKEVMFRIELDDKHLVLATISGKMSKRWGSTHRWGPRQDGDVPLRSDEARIVWRLN